MNDIDIKQTIEFWESWLDQKKSANVGEFMMYGGRSLETCKRYLQEKAERENPKPLKLEEIKAIKRPIPLYKKLLTNETGEYIGPNNEWWDVCCGTTEASGVIYWRSGHTNDVNYYGKTWICYYHEPKEATDDR